MVIDGIANFAGGMDSSRDPDFLEENQCAKLVNARIQEVGDEIGPRFGFHHQTIEFEDKNARQRYQNCKHIQGEGWYEDRGNRKLLVSADGWIFEFTTKSLDIWNGRILNRGDQNNPNRTKVWFERVPGGAVINDGESNPFYVSQGSLRRTDPSANEIGPGRMMAYVQNRLFYSSLEGDVVLASDINDPLKTTEFSSTGILGLTPPEGETITAIGRQKHLLRDINGGELVFSTDKNIYSADIIGDRIEWASRGVKLLVPESGATSSYSFSNFNSNLWYRTTERGIMNFKQSASQFLQDEDTTGHSVELDVWLERDTEWALDQCYTKPFKRRLFTTVCPSISEHGYVFWEGMVAMNPDPLYTNRSKLPRRFEGLWTGVRPWAFTEIHGANKETEFFIHSYDRDGVTRLYRMADDKDFDVNHLGQRKEIRWFGETRSMIYEQRFSMKTPKSTSYSMAKITRPTKVRFSSRTEGMGPWLEFFSTEHKTAGCLRDSKGCPVFYHERGQERPCVPLPQEKDNPGTPGSMGGKNFFTRAYRFDVEGPGHITRIISQADVKPKSESVWVDEQEGKPVSYELRDDFEYFIT